jgi:benzoyl-CoA reductase/2-hydroxyglutaryl-CoA dehydratase subunit BcrC/BadD/HgdB
MVTESELATKKGSLAVNDSTESSSQTVLYTCSYVPEEIILAAGFQPRRFLPEGHAEDTYVDANTCGYVKSMLSAAVEGAASKAAGIIIANSCDAMRRLYDLWAEYVTTTPALFLDVPKKTDAAAITFFASELRKLAASMERELPGRTVSDENLQRAVRTCNEVRLLMGDVFRAQRCAKKRARGTEVLELCLAGAGHAKTEFTSEIRRFLADFTGAAGNGKGPRILLTGGITNRPDLVAEIEDAGGSVVVLDSCIGLRHYESLVQEGAPDAMLALAERYLMKPPCGRMQGFERRLEYLKRTAEDAGADGMVFHSLKFCDTFLYDVPMMTRRFRELGMPFLWIEGDYPCAELGQTKTRVAAFLEMNW